MYQTLPHRHDPPGLLSLVRCDHRCVFQTNENALVLTGMAEKPPPFWHVSYMHQDLA